MIQELLLRVFKNFLVATLPLGNLTLLVGTNASGKSNLRYAFRFLHGVSRGYTLAEIIGEKWIERGTLQWKGIRGGTREATFCGEPTFCLQINTRACIYRIEVLLGRAEKPPSVVRESLYNSNWPVPTMCFYSHPADYPPEHGDNRYLYVARHGWRQPGPLQAPSISPLNRSCPNSPLTTNLQSLSYLKQARCWNRWSLCYSSTYSLRSADTVSPRAGHSLVTAARICRLSCSLSVSQKRPNRLF